MPSIRGSCELDDRRLAYGEDPKQSGELRLPAGSGPHPVAFLVHGGCWNAGHATLRDFRSGECVLISVHGMDNLAHTLTGAALGETGLKRLTGFGMPALMLSANVPDVDVFGLLVGEGLAWRRGWTHGPLALVILPAVLSAALVAFDRWQARRGTRPPLRLPVRLTPLLLVSYIGALSHLLLDFLNTYGIRLLMPFSERWFYGDTLFIIDPWIWLGLGWGVWAARRRARAGKLGTARPAVGALVAAALYGGAMYVAGRWAEDFTRRALTASGQGVPEYVLASPVAADPFRRAILVQTAEGYRFGDFRWSPWPHLDLEASIVPTRMGDPAIARAAARDERFANFLYWSRFPFATIERAGRGVKVTVNDGRYSRRAHSGPFRVSVLLVDEGTRTGSLPVHGTPPG